MRKNFVTNIFLLLAVNLLIKPFWILGVDRAVQNAVGNVDYGIYTNLFAFSLIFLVLLDFGINNYSSSSIARDHSIAGEQFSALIPLKVLFSAGYVLVTIVAGFLYGLNKSELFLLLVLSLNQVMAYFILYFRSNVSGLQLFRTDALLSVVDRALMIVFCGIIVWLAVVPLSIETFVYGQSMGYLLSLLICFAVLRPHLKHVRLTFSKAVLSRLVKDTFPYALMALLIALYTRMDVILLKRLVPDGDYENGIYAKAYRLLDASNMLAAMVASMLLPLFSKLLSSRNDLNVMVNTAMSLLLAPAIMLSFFCAVYRQEIIDLLYTDSTLYTGDVFGIVILGFAPTCLMYIFGTLLTANASLRLLNGLALGALVVSLSVNLYLIPLHGSLGAAIASLATQTFFGVGCWYFAGTTGLSTIALSMRRRYLFFTVLFGMLTFTLWQVGTPLLMGFLLCGTIGVVLVFALRIVRYDALLRFVSGVANKGA